MQHPALKMLDYHVWANKVIIDRLKELPEEIYHKDIQSGFSSVSKVLSHIYFVDCSWLDIISGKSMNEAFDTVNQLREKVELTSIIEIEELFLELSGRYNNFLSSLDDIDKIIIVDNPYAGLLETTISESILHVVTHGSYHRGNIATMLRQMGHTSVMQDYGLYLYSK
ncbi:DinB family protein [Ferdinandcohnia quinoae]|uniref:DinB family protein n=1 Tax=Fredinandcohnia quinoae TaxID=2918902 RepID=A0AAW5E6N9_9BACI|nr:DinB family protein [Fredinandcohnia sp. SECRCQ15]MCH1625285.1 DinB family protein [Fredinandcohnia sp. SECRCQ15]